MAENLVASCIDCNTGKASISPDAELVNDVRQDAMRWARAMKTAAEIFAAERERQLDYMDDFVAEWYRWKPTPVFPEIENSARRFHLAQLPMEEWRDATQIAMQNRSIPPDRKHQYACGIAWNKIRKMQETAVELLVEEEARQVPGQGAIDEH